MKAKAYGSVVTKYIAAATVVGGVASVGYFGGYFRSGSPEPMPAPVAAEQSYQAIEEHRPKGLFARIREALERRQERREAKRDERLERQEQLREFIREHIADQRDGKREAQPQGPNYDMLDKLFVRMAMPDGTKQCEPHGPMQTLMPQGSQVQQLGRCFDANKMYPQVCGAPTGGMIVIRVPRREIEQHQRNGFQVLASDTVLNCEGSDAGAPAHIVGPTQMPQRVDMMPPMPASDSAVADSEPSPREASRPTGGGRPADGTRSTLEH